MSDLQSEQLCKVPRLQSAKKKTQGAKQCGISEESKHGIRGQYQRTVGSRSAGLIAAGFTDAERRRQESGTAETQSSYTSY